jgi:hypothetical protein
LSQPDDLVAALAPVVAILNDLGVEQSWAAALPALFMVQCVPQWMFVTFALKALPLF